MGRSHNEKCWACSLLTPNQARQQHGSQDGDGCWNDAVCHSRRSYYRQGRGNRVRRQPQVAEVEAAAAQLLETQRLQFAGDALLQIAELCAVRAEVLMIQWEELVRDPIVEQGFFADVVRQAMAVDLSDLMEPARSRQQRAKPIAKPKESIAAPVDKAAVLAMVDHLEAEDEAAQKQSVLVIAHSEDVASWTAAILEWLQTTLLSVSIAELSDSLELPWIEVWLGVLFGGFQVEQRGEFYESPLWVKRSGDQAMTLRQDGS